MAALKAKALPVGSVQWIQNEREQAEEFISQDLEEFSFSVRNEMEWLNEHMADVFSKNQVNFVDVFKTPGKLRGKTPGTVGKRDALATRQPLTDIFAPSTPVAPPSIKKFDLPVKPIHVDSITDTENQPPQHRPISRGHSPKRTGMPYTDSGYHGMTEDEMDVDAPMASIASSSQNHVIQVVPIQDNQPRPQRIKEGKVDETGTSDESFVSAKEGTLASNTSKVSIQEDQVANDVVVHNDEILIDQLEEKTELEEVQGIADALDVHTDTQSASDVSSPNPLQRKSSFAFSGLPARERIGAKPSMGNRNSQIEPPSPRGSILGKSFGGKNVEFEATENQELSQEKPAETKAHNKTSTQLLQERINLLGKTKEPRPTKSIPSNALAGLPLYPQLPDLEADKSVTPPSDDQENAGPPDELVDDEDDWIAPAKPVELTHKGMDETQPTQPPVKSSPARPPMHLKSSSASVILSPTTTAMAPPTLHHKAFSFSQPDLTHTLASTTPAGSPPSKKFNDGPLSASKNRLWSAIKSAKNIFASSASASAAAKLEAHNESSRTSRWPNRDFSDDSKTTAILNMPGALYSEQELPRSPSRPISIVSSSPSKRTVGSTESDKKREREAKAQQKAATELEKARETERQKATKQHGEKLKGDQTQATRPQKDAQPTQRQEPANSDQTNTEIPPPPPPKNGLLGGGKLRAPGRAIRPGRQQAPTKPAPVSIRVASQLQRPGQAPGGQPALSKSQHESTAPPPPPKDNFGGRPSSSQSSKGGPPAPNNARLKALEAAARKKEADDKAAQRKVEQKRELERKRAAKAEEEKRAEEERKVAEQQRVQEAKLAAQRKAEKQAADARKREQERLDQQRLDQQKREQERAELLKQQEEARKAKEAHELAEAIKRERAQQAQAQPPRSDIGGTLRQLIKHAVPVQINPAKPAKRQLPVEDDESGPSLQRPALQRGPPSYQQTDAKRRRTNEEQDELNERRSVMAPPKRPSNLRKETLNKFPHGYTNAPPSAPHHGGSIFKATVTAQHQLQHATKGPPTHPSQMVQISNARIPFAEDVSSHHGTSSQLHASYETSSHAAAQNKFKTPVRSAHAPKSAKSSPLYQNGDNIALPEIATDSEDEDSDDGDQTGGFRAPSWVASPALRELLTQQQLVDPETVFGPIGELKMDEVFKNAKNQERLKKFRDRGSSAMWVESGDAVTSAEKRKDMQLRERVAKEGGWRYEPSV